MLLEFKVKNYKSFKNEAVLSLIPAPKQKDIEYSVLKTKIGKTEFKALPTSVLYGPNASGKTNIIGAIETFVSLISRGNILNPETYSSFNAASSLFELIPYMNLKRKEPVEFYISFIKNKEHFEYSLQLDLGLFLRDSYDRKILFEELKVNGVVEFTRTDIIQTTRHKSANMQNIINVLTSNLNKKELFLSNGYKNVINNNLYNKIHDFLNNDLVVIYRADAMRILKKSEPNKKFIRDKELSFVAQEIGAFNSDIGFYFKDGESSSQLTTFYNASCDKSGFPIPSEAIESLGTIRFLNLYPIIKKALQKGGILIIDEFDASIHPNVLLDIVNIFHNDEININNAQLIFNTHNPVFLNPSVLRRDEIKFVEKDENGSSIYSLADFQTSGQKGVRKTDDYMKHYFMNKYGAIVDVNLSDLIKPKKNED